MSKWFVCGVIHLDKQVFGELSGKYEEKKEREKETKRKKERKKRERRKGGNEGSWPTHQEIGSFPTWDILV